MQKEPLVIVLLLGSAAILDSACPCKPQRERLGIEPNLLGFGSSRVRGASKLWQHKPKEGQNHGKIFHKYHACYTEEPIVTKREAEVVRMGRHFSPDSRHMSTSLQVS